MIFKNSKVYDILKYLALIFFNAVGVLYKTVAEIWSLPYGNEVALTCSAIALFIGTLIGISSYQYNHTQAEILEEDEELIKERDEEDD